ncbi:hypothetical protein J0383_13615 [Flavobacterium endoglycinae]|uniref:Uncharacterized protein n=1 Tax=Flavobacterium endoglycinae TaxID=2816357 RepID=A0ABX7Q8J4_9FLAO|nr:hypothetical protein [Flavobacterium endoglycinae]QSW87334.1 hypothetical protein J0383_13615 [Flavobacterium endoglycinae]
MEFKNFNFDKDKDFIPAVRSSLFGADPAIKRISAAAGAGDPVFRRKFPETDVFKTILKERKTAVKNKKSSEMTI